MKNDETDTSSHRYCFQVDRVDRKERLLTITGVAFQYTYPSSDFSISLKSVDDGKMIPLNTERIDRQDVNQYFFCDYDYTHSGFIAVGEVDPEEEYEIIVKFQWPLELSTSVYVVSDRVYYSINENDIAPKGLENIIDNGTLRISRPDYHCWVYQVGNDLYWIVDKAFCFEEDGSTIIEYQLWTTQEDRLPQDRIQNGWYWANLSSSFESCELSGDFGQYRIMKRGLPTEYSITTIETGYYKNGEWVWRNYFRPIYYFIN